MKKPPKSKTKRPTKRQKKAIEILLKSTDSVGQAMRDAGYSESAANKPSTLTESKAYKDVLDKAGLTSEFLAKLHKSLATAVRTDERRFPWRRKGKKWSRPSDEDIRKIVETHPDHRLLYIQDDYMNKCSIAYVVLPEAVARGKALEQGYKVKGLYSPTQFSFPPHDTTPEEEELLSSLFKKNKK